MNSFEATLEQLTAQWSGKTLEAFRREGAAEANGTVFEAVRGADGPRLVMILCATKRAQISLVERIFDLSEAVSPCDWSRVTIPELLLRTVTGNRGLSYEDLRDKDGRRTAIILCATKPETIRHLEQVFTFS